MFSSHFTRFPALAALVFALIFLLFPACGFFGGENNQSSGPAAPDARGPAAGAIPFAAREPETFQAELVTSAEGAERRTFLARRGARRRLDFDFGARHQLTRIESERVYLVYPAGRLLAEAQAATETAGADEWQEFLTTEWLNARPPVRFDKLETVGNITRYRVAPEENGLAEILVSVDETAGLPVKQEFYSIAGPEKTLTMTIELVNFQLAADESLFTIPADYRRVTVDELLKIWREEVGN